MTKTNKFLNLIYLNLASTAEKIAGDCEATGTRGGLLCFWVCGATARTNWLLCKLRPDFFPIIWTQIFASYFAICCRLNRWAIACWHRTTASNPLIDGTRGYVQQLSKPGLPKHQIACTFDLECRYISHALTIALLQIMCKPCY